MSASRFKLWHRDALAMAGLVLGLCVITIAVGERIGVNGGQGWDGIAYTQWAQEFWHKVVNAGLNRYQSQRVLPSALVHYGLRLAGATTDARHAITGFQVLNTAILIGSAVMWAHLGHAMRWSRPAVWVGFVALFGCFANARHALYYPTLTDPTAFGAGMVMVWGFLTGRAWALVVAMLAGVVTWPALPPIAAALLLVPKSSHAVEPGPRRRTRLVGSFVLAAIAAAAFIAVAMHYLDQPVPGVGDEKFAAWVDRDLLPITLVTLGAMLVYGWYVLLDQPVLWNLRAQVRQLEIRRTALALAAVIAVYVLRAVWLANVGTQGEGPTTAQFLCEHTLTAIRKPLWGFVHQVVYYGPIVLVALASWRRIAVIVPEWGPAAVLGLAMVVAFMAGANSRQWNHLFPLLVAATIAATHELWSMWSTLVFALFGAAWSKLWLHIGYDVHDNWQRFPNQRYFMNHGPYANDTMYTIHGGAAILTLVALVRLLRRANAGEGGVGLVSEKHSR